MHFGMSEKKRRHKKYYTKRAKEYNVSIIANKKTDRAKLTDRYRETERFKERLVDRRKTERVRKR